MASGRQGKLSITSLFPASTTFLFSSLLNQNRLSCIHGSLELMDLKSCFHLPERLVLKPLYQLSNSLETGPHSLTLFYKVQCRISHGLSHPAHPSLHSQDTDANTKLTLQPGDICKIRSGALQSSGLLLTCESKRAQVSSLSTTSR